MSVYVSVRCLPRTRHRCVGGCLQQLHRSLVEAGGWCKLQGEWIESMVSWCHIYIIYIYHTLYIYVLFIYCIQSYIMDHHGTAAGFNSLKSWLYKVLEDGGQAEKNQGRLPKLFVVWAKMWKDGCFSGLMPARMPHIATPEKKHTSMEQVRQNECSVLLGGSSHLVSGL